MDLYQEVTNRIMEQLENGIIPWEKPWISAGSAVSHATGKPYSLLNQMLLGRPGEYVTFKQCQQEGGKIRKGEKSSMVVFWKWIEQEVEETGEKKEVPFLGYFNVFHIDQCEGLTAKHTQQLPNAATADQTAEEIIAGYVQRSGVRINHEASDQAFYRPSSDSITLPLMAQFKTTAEYYSTAFHEAVHSTGHKTRLDRLEKTAFFGSEAYSKEELIAEIGAATLINHADLETPDGFRNNAAYIQNWLQVLHNDKRFIVSAAGKADPMSEAFLQMAGGFSQLELAMIRARVKSGMANAKANGRPIGRPRTTEHNIPAIFYRHYPAYASGQLNVSELARVCGLSRPTVYKYLKLL